MRARDAQRSLTGPMGISALFHVSVVLIVAWTVRPEVRVPLPPIYKVNIIAAPPGPRAIGEVKSGPAPDVPADAPVPKSREVAPAADVAPTVAKKAAPAAAKPTKATPTSSTAAKATPNASTGAKASPNTPAPKAGGGPKGGTGADVATIQTDGIEFPFPNYLNNIVRQIALNFKPKNPNSPLRAQVSFLIRRDGTVADIKVVTKSGSFSFDLEARGAIEKAGKSFGPLPNGFEEDVLPIVFSFDPKFVQ